MSIIYDALKRVEKTVDKSVPVAETAKAKSTNKTRPILLFIFVIVLGLFAGNMLFSLLTRPKAKPMPSLASPAVTPVNKIDIPIQTEKPAPPLERIRTTEPNLILSGVYFQGKLGYALINNKILKTEDTILGARVESISLEKVILEFEGRKITLINAAR